MPLSGIEGDIVNQWTLSGWARRCVVIGFSIACNALLVATGTAAQVVFNVNTTDDGADADVADGTCQIAPPAPPGTCTLRAAVMQANRMSNAGAEIRLSAGTYNLTIPASIADGEENGDLNLIVPVGYAPGPTTITGAGAATTIIDAHGIDRVLHIDAARIVTVTGISFINGLLASGSSFGGGVYNQGQLTLTDCIFSHNAVSYGNGGGIFNQGYLAATRVWFEDNSAQSYGGGIYNLSQLELSQCTVAGNKAIKGAGIYNASDYYPYSQVDWTEISGNTATSSGGGVVNAYSSSRLNITRSLISNNTAPGAGGIQNAGTLYVSGSTLTSNTATATGGGAIANSAALFAIDSTISGNSANGDGGGIDNVSGTANVYSTTIVFNVADYQNNAAGGAGGIYNKDASGAVFNLRNTLVAGNSVSGYPVYDECAGTLHSFGRNLIGAGADSVFCSITAESGSSWGYLNSYYLIGSLQNNGGPTSTHALLPGSNAIDGAVICTDQNGTTIPTDQRGFPRAVGATCDIGAYESDPGRIYTNGFE